ncbi:uncharacterized protein LOC132789280 isoform X10 [Drosophila nasuta]|uniref:uncharacterized protein LOC132789280 isoform X10 n=1 Tax=Drosophila nasuta TaxID=42062 RepID=UPI00295EE59A|nr:uncharacterized protein LOC132789280 isoform X10 [Drosophila nasuta]
MSDTCENLLLCCRCLYVCVSIIECLRWCDSEEDREQRAPVVVTSATHTAPGGYPVTTVPARTYQTTTYATPYPAQTTGPNLTVQMPMPMPTAHSPMPGVQQPQGAPYPPVQQYPGAGAANMNPPSYDAAMANSSPSVAAPGYEKQMPYNPNY